MTAVGDSRIASIDLGKKFVAVVGEFDVQQPLIA
jgi:hypothetical protein